MHLCVITCKTAFHINSQLDDLHIKKSCIFTKSPYSYCPFKNRIETKTQKQYMKQGYWPTLFVKPTKVVVIFAEKELSAVIYSLLNVKQNSLNIKTKDKDTMHLKRNLSRDAGICIMSPQIQCCDSS